MAAGHPEAGAALAGACLVRLMIAVNKVFKALAGSLVQFPLASPT
jgi:hypothetical protein